MNYWKARLFEMKQRYWIYKSKRLFKRYGKLDLFTYACDFDMNLNDILGDSITVSGNYNNDKNGNDPKTYYVVNTKEQYKDLKHMLKLEVSIRYSKHTGS